VSSFSHLPLGLSDRNKISLLGHFASVATFKHAKHNKRDINVYVFTRSWTVVADCDEVQLVVPKFLNRKATNAAICTISINLILAVSAFII